MFSDIFKGYRKRALGTNGLMNTANKPALTETLWKMTEKSMPTSTTSNVLYLLDGGNLLNKLQWKKGETVQ